MQMIRKVVEQEGHRLVDLGRSDHVVVVEHHDPLLPRLLFTGSSDVVDERGQGGGGRGGGQRLEDCRVDIEFGALQGGHQVGHEAGQVVVAVIEGEPANPCIWLSRIEVGEPVTEQGGLAEASRCGHESQPMARIEGGVEPLGDPGATPGSPGTTCSSCRARTRCATATPATSPGATFAQALGWTGARVASSYAACASGVTALEVARTRILAGLCDVALVVGADTTPKGFLAPNAGDRPDDPDWLRFRLVGATNPTYFALYARRRMDLYGATDADFAQVKVKNARHGLAQPERPVPQGGHRGGGAGQPDGGRPAAPARDLRHLRRRARPSSCTSMDYARRARRRPGAHRGVSTVTPTYPEHGDRPAELRHRLGRRRWRRRSCTFSDSIAHAAYEEAGIGPDDLGLAEVYDLSTALELDWYEDIGLCKPGEAEQLLNDGDTTIGGRIPVNPSGGLACFGEAVPAQALAQVCEVTWQLRGQADGRQVEGAQVGVTVNQGLFGHGSSVLLDPRETSRGHAGAAEPHDRPRHRPACAQACCRRRDARARSARVATGRSTRCSSTTTWYDRLHGPR